MSFATPTDVSDLFRNLITTGTDAAITDAKIQKWLDAESEFVLGKIGTLYRLPITALANPKSALILADIEAGLVAGKVDDILNSYKEGDKKPYWRKNALDRLKELVPEKDSSTGKQPEPVVKLPDAEYIGTSTQRGRVSLSDTTTAPTFVKGRDNW